MSFYLESFSICFFVYQVKRLRRQAVEVAATTPVLNISEAEKKRLIAEEAARMEALKVRAITWQ